MFNLYAAVFMQVKWGFSLRITTARDYDGLATIIFNLFFNHEKLKRESFTSFVFRKAR